jgi:hypothetical protein
MRDAQNENSLTLIFDPANHPVASDAIAPETHLVAHQRLSLEPRITLSGDARLKKRDNPILRDSAQFLKFAESTRFEVNGPSQAA